MGHIIAWLHRKGWVRACDLQARTPAMCTTRRRDCVRCRGSASGCRMRSDRSPPAALARARCHRHPGSPHAPAHGERGIRRLQGKCGGCSGRSLDLSNACHPTLISMATSKSTTGQGAVSISQHLSIGTLRFEGLSATSMCQLPSAHPCMVVILCLALFCRRRGLVIGQMSVRCVCCHAARLTPRHELLDLQ